MKNKREGLPGFPAWILRKLNSSLLQEGYSGDIEEEYYSIKEVRSQWYAWFWLYFQAFRSIPGGIRNMLMKNAVMFRNYFKIAVRNIWKQKGYSFLNIAGLAIGMACSILILLWVNHELSYDKFHHNYKNTYRIIQHIKYDEVVNWAITQGPLGPSLKEEFPEVTEFVRTRGTRLNIGYKDREITEFTTYTDPSFFRLFNIKLKKGDPDAALSNPNSIILTQEAAAALFRDEDPVGKTVTISEEKDLKVTGVLEDIPDNTHLQIGILTTMQYALERGNSVNRWNNSGFYTYIQLQEGTDPEVVNLKIYDFLDNKPTVEDWEKISLQPMEDIHLTSGIGYDVPTGSKQFVIIFSIIALLVLFIACINFMNLSTARFSARAKEVALRKVVGAEKIQLIIQFLNESVIQAIIGFSFAMVLAVLLLPLFNELSGKNFSMQILYQREIIVGYLSVVTLTGLISGSYPAFFLSSFKPANMFKGISGSGLAGAGFRKTLVVFQFSISIILIIGSMVIYSQVEYIQNRDLGFDRNDLLCINFNNDNFGKFETLKNELLSKPEIIDITSSSSLPTSGFVFSNSRWSWEGKDPDDAILFRANVIGHEYFKTLGIKMLEGRDFTADISKESLSVIINKTALELMGLQDPIGKKVTYGNSTDYNIIGVAENFHFRSLHSEIEPLLLFYGPDNSSIVYARLSPENTTNTISYIEKSWTSLFPGETFNYGFIDELLSGQYYNEEHIGNIVRSFMLLAIIISCLGLFGLSAYMAEQRTKEIGIRKVLGSSISEIIVLISKPFSKWIITANLISWPLAYIIMSGWLNGYPYRTAIDLRLFFITGIAVFIISFITIGYQSVRAARKDPVESLRYE
ncbi:MAG: FtsX-like permease family protein [bacterium]|nr:FtsX-like permease family protein [bacterium]